MYYWQWGRPVTLLALYSFRFNDHLWSRMFLSNWQTDLVGSFVGLLSLQIFQLFGTARQSNWSVERNVAISNVNYYFSFKSLFLPRVAEFIYIEGDNKRVVSSSIILAANWEPWDETDGRRFRKNLPPSPF